MHDFPLRRVDFDAYIARISQCVVNNARPEPLELNARAFFRSLELNWVDHLCRIVSERRDWIEQEGLCPLPGCAPARELDSVGGNAKAAMLDA